MAGRDVHDVHSAPGGISRRSVLGGAALGAAGLAAGGLRAPAFAKRKGPPPPPAALNIVADAKPTRAGLVGPGGVGWHVGGVGRGSANSSIYDFDGVVAGADIRGPGMLFPSGTVDEGDAIPIEFDADVRLMQGGYIDRGGHKQWGTFAFI